MALFQKTVTRAQHWQRFRVTMNYPDEPKRQFILLKSQTREKFFRIEIACIVEEFRT